MKRNLPINKSFENLNEYGSISESIVAVNVEDYEEGGQGTREDDLIGIGLRQFTHLGQEKVEKWQISFEKYFLSEHTTTLKNQLQNFLEFALQNQPSQKQQSLTRDRTVFFTQQSSRTLSDVLKEESIAISHMHKDEFLKRMQQLQDLSSFLSHILKHFHQVLAKELIIISISIWIQFRNQDFKYLKRKQLLSKSDLWVRQNSHSYFERSDFTYLNFRCMGTPNEMQLTSLLKQFRKFIRYFSATVLLILAGFFQNPYSSEHPNSSIHSNYPKRQLPFDTFDFLSDNSSFSDEEESFGAKKYRKQQ